jgi:tellurite resistance protein
MSSTRSTAMRIPLNTFAIGFGLAGLADAWTAAVESLGLPSLLGQSFWLVTIIAFVWLLVAHTVRGARSSDSLASQLRHPAQGPIAALVPITGMLIADDLLEFAPVVGVALFVVSLVFSAGFAAWIIGTWLQDGLMLESVHGGYLLPTVAAGFVAAWVASRAGLPLLGWGLFGVGAFFWVIMTTLLVIRLAFRPSLPDPLVPTMAILVAPPGVAGVAWFTLSGPQASPVAAMLAGLGVILLLVQFTLVRTYLRLKFSLGFWSFTFPAAAIVTDAMLWMRIVSFDGWRAVTVVLLALVTAIVGVVAVRSLVDIAARGRVRAEATLTTANDVDAAVTG